MLNLNLRGEVEASLILETARRFEVTGENGYAFAKDIVERGLEAIPKLMRELIILVMCVCLNTRQSTRLHLSSLIRT